MKGDRRCENCWWWGRERAHMQSAAVGTCRALLPALGEREALPYHDPDRPDAAGPIVRRGEWPWTAFDDWCREFHQREERDE